MDALTSLNTRRAKSFHPFSKKLKKKKKKKNQNAEVVASPDDCDRALPDTSDEVCGGVFSWNWGLVERGQSFYNTSCEMNHKRGGTYGQKTERGRGGAAAPDGGGAPAAGAQAQCGG